MKKQLIWVMDFWGDYYPIILFIYNDSVMT